MRVDADGDAHIVVIGGERQRRLARGNILRRGQDPVDARLPRAVEDLDDIGRKAAIGEMRVRVDPTLLRVARQPWEQWDPTRLSAFGRRPT